MAKAKQGIYFIFIAYLLVLNCEGKWGGNWGNGKWNKPLDKSPNEWSDTFNPIPKDVEESINPYKDDQWLNQSPKQWEDAFNPIPKDSKDKISPYKANQWVDNPLDQSPNEWEEDFNPVQIKQLNDKPFPENKWERKWKNDKWKNPLDKTPGGWQDDFNPVAKDSKDGVSPYKVNQWVDNPLDQSPKEWEEDFNPIQAKQVNSKPFPENKWEREWKNDKWKNPLDKTPGDWQDDFNPVPKEVGDNLNLVKVKKFVDSMELYESSGDLDGSGSPESLESVETRDPDFPSRYGKLLPRCPSGCLCVQSMDEVTVKCSSKEPLDEAKWQKIPPETTRLILENVEWPLAIEDPWANLPNITYLKIRKSKLTTLQDGAFNNLSNLETLDLSYVLIRDIEEGAFKNLTSLTSLSLVENLLFEVPAASLAEIPNLKYLNLSANPITAIHKGDFNGLENVKMLQLNNMYILNSVEEDAFTGMSSLESLSLQKNSMLVTLPSRFSETPLENLREIILARNGLKTLTEETFDNMPSLKKVVISGNKFHCDCNIAWVKDHTKIFLPKGTFRVIGYVMCWTPIYLRGRSVSSLSPAQLSCDVPDIQPLPPLLGFNAIKDRPTISIKAVVFPETPLNSWILPNNKYLKGNGTVDVSYKTKTSAKFIPLADGNIEAQLDISGKELNDIIGDYTLVSSNQNGDTAVTYTVAKDPSHPDQVKVTASQPQTFERADDVPPPQTLDDFLALLGKEDGSSAGSFVLMGVSLAFLVVVIGLSVIYFASRLSKIAKQTEALEEKAPLLYGVSANMGLPVPSYMHESHT